MSLLPAFDGPDVTLNAVFDSSLWSTATTSSSNLAGSSGLVMQSQPQVQQHQQQHQLLHLPANPHLFSEDINRSLNELISASAASTLMTGVGNLAPADFDFDSLFGLRPFSPPPALFDETFMTAESTRMYSAAADTCGSGVSAGIGGDLEGRLDEFGCNALHLDVSTLATPVGSPRGRQLTRSTHTSPSFQFSPTPALTACPTVDSTPAARSNSRCSSRSSLSFATTAPTPDYHAVTSASTAAANATVGSRGGRKLHLCPYDGCARATRTFRSNADLQRHIRSHRGERPYACPSPGCGKAYGQQNKMVNHVKMQHPSILNVVMHDAAARSASRGGAASSVRRPVANVGLAQASSQLQLATSVSSYAAISNVQDPLGIPLQVAAQPLPANAVPGHAQAPRAHPLNVLSRSTHSMPGITHGVTGFTHHNPNDTRHLASAHTTPASSPKHVNSSLAVATSGSAFIAGSLGAIATPASSW